MGAVQGYDVSISNKLGTNGEHTTFSVNGTEGGTPYKFQVTITRWPTGNCQVSAFGYMNNLLTHTKKNKDHVLAVMKECFRLLDHSPRLIMVDVQERYIGDVEGILEIIHKHAYTSTNSSKMCMFLAKMPGTC